MIWSFKAKEIIPGVVDPTVQQILNTQFAGAPQQA
jgi:hypothetical protein